MAVVVLGAGNTGLSIAAKLALEGHDVVLWEHPDHAAAVAPIRDSRRIMLLGTGGEGAATLASVTTDAGDALSAGDILLASVPSYAHAAFASALLPHLRPRHLLTLLPGNLGSLAFAHRLRAADARPLLAESDTAPYVCRKTAPDEATIWGVVPAMGIGAFPAHRTGEALERLRSYFPGLQPYPHTLAAGLGAMNPIVHPPGVLMNAGRIERSRGEFYFYEEGVTPGVVRVIEALDAERRALAEAFDITLTSVAEAFHAAGFGPKGDLWSAINGSRMLTALRAPGSLQTRWLSEDVPFGLRTWVELGRVAGVPMPVADALITLADQVMGADSWATGRSLEDLGIDDLERAALMRYLTTGTA
ncbi:MAG TPA: NAD/NADP octopine/nopaline dehydrogenase family protein [Chloroflexota bacterium]|nr:NAD/NADP octopine/nopaline dehydrogenase family protein [Chloroflexota bacterium]